MGQFDNVTKVQNTSIIPFNGAYYTKDGNIHNLDGTSGPGSNASKSMPFTGVFIGSDGKPHDIDEIFARFGQGGGNLIVPEDLAHKIDGVIQRNLTLYDYLNTEPKPTEVILPVGSIHNLSFTLEDCLEFFNICNRSSDRSTSILMFTSIASDFRIVFQYSRRSTQGTIKLSYYQSNMPNHTLVETKIATISINNTTEEVINEVWFGNNQIVQEDYYSFTNYDNAVLYSYLNLDVDDIRLLNLWKHMTTNIPTIGKKDLDEVRSDLIGEILTINNYMIYHNLQNDTDFKKIRETPTLLRGDYSKFDIETISIVDGGSGYSVGDTLVVSSNGANINIEVLEVAETTTAVKTIKYTYSISEIDPATEGIAVTATGGSGSGASFEITTKYAMGDSDIKGTLELVPQEDPIVQDSRLVGYVGDIITSYFPVDTLNIKNQAVTASKISDTALYAGDGINIVKDDNGIMIEAIASVSSGETVSVTFLNLDENDNVIS